MKKNIISIILFVLLVCAGITIYFQHKTITEQHSTINDFRAYYNAVEDLLDTIDNDVNITDTYMCGDVGYNYYQAVIKITDCNRIKTSNYKPINKQCYGE